MTRRERCACAYATITDLQDAVQHVLIVLAWQTAGIFDPLK